MAETAEQRQPRRRTRYEFNTTFQGQKLVLRVKRDGVVADLKAAITDETRVPAKRKKLIGLVKGALPPDESKLAELVGPRGEKPPTKFLLMGTPDDKLFIDPKDRDDLPEIIDDLDPVPPAWKSTSDAIEQMHKDAVTGKTSEI